MDELKKAILGALRDAKKLDADQLHAMSSMKLLEVLQLLRGEIARQELLEEEAYNRSPEAGSWNAASVDVMPPDCINEY
jgi:hypothetical protein